MLSIEGKRLTKADVLRMLDGAVEAGTPPSAANHALAAIRKFFNWCVERGGALAVNPLGELLTRITMGWLPAVIVIVLGGRRRSPRMLI